MIDRDFVAPDRRRWTFRPRPRARAGEVGKVLALDVVTDGESRVVTCDRADWEDGSPDLAELLARSVVSGASRHI
jgi:hypothetical protein